MTLGRSTARERMSRHDHAAALFLPLSFDPDECLFLMEDHSVGFLFAMDPLPWADEATADKVATLLTQDYPDGTFVQFSLFASPNIHPQMRRMVGLRPIPHPDDPRGRVLHETTASRARFLHAHVHADVEHAHGSRVRDFLLLVSVKCPVKGMLSPQEYDHVVALRAALEKSLRTVGFQPGTVDADAYVRLLGSMLNWSPDAAWRDHDLPAYDERELVREQLLDLDNVLQVEKEGLRLGEKRVRTLSVKRYPSHVALPMNILYLGELRTGAISVRENFLLTVTLYYPPADVLRNSLERKRTRVNHVTYGPMEKFMPRVRLQKESFDVLFGALEDGDRAVKANMTLVIFSDTEQEAVAASSGARTYFGSLGYKLLEDAYFCKPLFLNALPLNAEAGAVRDLQRFRTFATRHVRHLLPILGDWKGSPTPVLNFVSRNGQLMAFDFFDSELSYNALIAAESGSGKSFLTNAILSNYLSLGGRAWVIDVGRSYEKLCKALSGEFMEFSRARHLCINPFPIVGDYDEEADMLLGLVSMMAMPTETMNDYQTAGLREVLKDQWDAHGAGLSIDALAIALKAHGDPRITDLGAQLYPFTSRGDYGRYFNGPNNVEFANPFVVLELEELKGRKHLQKTVLLMLIYQIQQAMYLGPLSQRSLKKFVIIDEAWDLLATGGAINRFIVGAFRRFRKVNGAAAVVTQSVNDLYETPGGHAIAENSPIKLLLGQRPETINDLRASKRIDISDGYYEVLKTLHTVPGEYSEIFISSPMGGGIGRLIVDRFTQLLYSTTPHEVQGIMQRMARGMDICAAIEHTMAEERLARAQP